jgi:hypothetical protein
MLKTILFALGGVLMAASTAVAGPFTIGDVFASVGNGLVREFTPTGTLVQTLNTNTNSVFTTGGVFDSSGNSYVTTFSSGIVSTFAAGSTSGTNFASVGGDEESITRSMSNNFFVGQADGGGQITELNSSGATVRTFTAAVQDRGTDWVDLAADQTTLYYTSEGSSIMRFSTVGTGSQLSDFETGKGTTMFALRILSDGGVLVANTSNVLEFDSAGNIVRTYTIPGAVQLFALNLDSDGVTAWTGDLSTNEVTRFNIATGAIISQWNAGTGTLAGLTVFGEITQGGGGGVPEPGTLVLLGLGGATLALLQRRRARPSRA